MGLLMLLTSDTPPHKHEGACPHAAPPAIPGALAGDHKIWRVRRHVAVGGDTHTGSLTSQRAQGLRTSTNNFPRFQRFHGFNLQPMKPRAVSKVGLKLQLRLRLQVSRKRPSCHLQQLQRFHRKLETLRRFHWFHWPFATVSKVSPTI